MTSKHFRGAYWRFLIFGAVLGFAAMTPVQAACTNPSPLPAGFAAPCPVFSLSAASVTQAQTLTLTATPQVGTDYIYTTVYISNNNAWSPFTLAGNNAYPNYASALSSLTLSSAQLQTLTLGTHYAVAWDWLWDATAQCYKGPGLNQCNAGQWRVQKFDLTSSYAYSQSTYYAYSQAAYYAYSQNAYYTYSQSAYSGTLPNGFYTTNFPLTENPISEGGVWVNGKAVGIDWSDFRVTSGHAYGTQVPGGPPTGSTFNDSIAVLKGTWSPNQTVESTVVENNGYGYENEVLVHFTLTPHSAKGYEIMCGGGYVNIVRWNGPIGNWTQIAASTAFACPATGGKLKGTVAYDPATKVNTLTLYINGVQGLQVTDNTAQTDPAFASGNPGIGQFVGASSTNNINGGSTSFTAQNTGGTYTYSQASYYAYSQSSYYVYSQATYNAYTYSQSSYYAYSQSAYTGGTAPWSGVLAPSRATDWSKAGLPAILPDGEATANPWTPPTRTQCGATVTSAANIQSAINACPAGQFVLLGPGTFSIGTITLKSNVTLRGSGAQATTLTGGSINWGGPSGQGSWGGGSFLSGTIAKGATSVTVANGQTVPTGGRMAALSQCMTGMTAPDANYTHYSGGDWVSKCTGTVADPSGPWVCGGLSQCDRNGNRGETNPHFQGQIFWIPSNGISGNTVNFTSPIESPLWSTGNSASLMWMSANGTVGAGLEDLTSVNWVGMNGCYACWMKGVRVIFTDSGPVFTSFVSHTLIANNYFAANSGGLHTIQLGAENDTTSYDSDTLLLNNIFIGGGYIEENGGNSGYVQAYNYFANVPGGYAGDFPHNPGGQVFMLREGNQSAITWDDDTWTAHNFSTWFRNWASGADAGGNIGIAMDVGGFSRFDNVIGNVIGNLQNANVYGQVLGVNRDGIDTTGLTRASLMRWGNYVYCTGDATHCQVSTGAFDNAEVPTNLSSYGANSMPYQNSVPANHNLPASFFMNGITAHPNGGTGLSWWKTCTNWTSFPTGCGSYVTPAMPPVGPDVTGGQNMNGHAHNIPAYIAFSNLPTDPAYGNNIRQFDERVYHSDP